MTQISPILNFVWKLPAVIILIIVGIMTFSQAGQSGLDDVLNFQIMGFVEEIITWLYFIVSAILSFLICYVIEKISRKSLWIAIPIFTYSAIVMGAWNGYWSDFDSTRREAIKYNYANAYAIEHMSERARYLSCYDKRIDLTEDAKAACTHALTVAPGEKIPGSEHHCGFLNSFSCSYYAPTK